VALAETPKMADWAKGQQNEIMKIGWNLESIRLGFPELLLIL